ncbi:helix-turn-helix domain-containing protein [Streptomyces sp. NPDC088261]|uniref:AlbA family DNA-binding domain-containing protein n=1 Tax=Streptomyces sp. NPDC088261 TaxID=3365851 RepID=UPI00382BAD58
MTLNFETDELVVGLKRQRALIKAVLGASSADESCWLEWKSRLDVSKAEGAFSISKAILGFANRMPDVAAQWAEGHAYLLVGVDEEALHGVQTYDIEKVDPWLRRYLGVFNRYQMTYVPFDSGEGTRHVMLVDIFPPRWGDPLYTLRKEYQSYRPGTIFHRYAGRTEPAHPAEIEALTERALRATMRVNVGVELTNGTVALVKPTDGLRAKIIDHRRETLLKQLDNSSLEKKFGKLGLSTSLELFRSMQPGDYRSPQIFREQVEEYLRDFGIAVQRTLINNICAAGAPVTLKLTNPGEDNLTQVEVVLSLPGTVLAHLSDEDENIKWPKPPEEYGTAGLPIGSIAISGTVHMYSTAISRPQSRHSPDIHQEEGRTIIRFVPVDLRPHETVNLDSITLYSIQERVTDTISGEWQATATNLSGKVQRSLYIATRRLELDPPVIPRLYDDE